MKAFKRFAYPFKKLCIRLTLQLKRLRGLLIRLKNLHPFNAFAKTFKRFVHPFKKICIRSTLQQKHLNGLLTRFKKKSYLFKVPRKALDCLPIILLQAVRSINLTFARYSPVLEIQKDRILFWFYLLRDHSKRVSVASFDKQVTSKYPGWYISQTPSQGGGIAYATLFRETSGQEKMKFIFNNNKNKQRRRL